MNVNQAQESCLREWMGGVSGDLLRHRHALYHTHSHAHCYSVRVRHECCHARLRPACVCAV